MLLSAPCGDCSVWSSGTLTTLDLSSSQLSCSVPGAALQYFTGLEILILSGNPALVVRLDPTDAKLRCACTCHERGHMLMGCFLRHGAVHFNMPSLSPVQGNTSQLLGTLQAMPGLQQLWLDQTGLTGALDVRASSTSPGLCSLVGASSLARILLGSDQCTQQ